jgi:hypothetical protein
MIVFNMPKINLEIRPQFYDPKVHDLTIGITKVNS